MATLDDIVSFLDALLRTAEIPDYDRALNGLQFASSTPITRVAAAVDFSSTVVRDAGAAGANLLLVHHGMFWGGLRPFVGTHRECIAELVQRDMAVYSSHLPLDLHPVFGNNVLLARELGLRPEGGFARFQQLEIGVSGSADIDTRTLVDRARRFAEAQGGSVVATPFPEGRVTRRWGICTGAGADSGTIREALARGLDTIVVGEGPHHTAVEARDAGLVIVYAGHYATETLGVRALAGELARRFGIEHTFIAAPTGL